MGRYGPASSELADAVTAANVDDATLDSLGATSSGGVIAAFNRVTRHPKFQRYSRTTHNVCVFGALLAAPCPLGARCDKEHQAALPVDLRVAVLNECRGTNRRR
jgi:hypothetical protein